MSSLLNGLAASSGIAIAPAYLLVGPNLSVNQEYSVNENHEVKRLHDSFTLTLAEVKKIRQHAHETLGKSAVAVVDEQFALLNDHGLYNKALSKIEHDHYSAEWAIQELAEDERKRLEKENEHHYFSARAMALKDVSKRLLSHLLGVKLPDPTLLDHRAIIVAPNITPTDAAQFDRRFVAGLVANEGGQTSHLTIMSKTLSLPAVVGIKEATSIIKNGDLLIVDGIHGKVIVNPSTEEIDHYQRLAAKFDQEQQEWGAVKDEQTVSTDGRHFKVVANVGMPVETSEARKNGAEGIGLVRSEFLYASNSFLPSEMDQVKAYKQFLTEMPGQRVVVRTLDIGGDKKPEMLELPKENNPFLGFRAIRIGLAKPEILRPQLRALLRSSVYGRLAIMFPMVATIEEFRQARKILDEEKQQLIDEGIAVANNIEVGMMLEIPSSAIMADVFAREVDFFSIGSNDLIQYLFAADRGNSQVAYLYQELHPAVLRLVKRVIDAAHAEGKWVSMCGEMASNPLATPLLMAMGLDEFSMNSSSILHIRSLINQLNTRQLQPLVHKALNAATASEVETMIRNNVPQVGK